MAKNAWGDEIIEGDVVRNEWGDIVDVAPRKPTKPGDIPTDPRYDRAPAETTPEQRYGDRSVRDRAAGGVASALNKTMMGLKTMVPGVELSPDDRRRLGQHREFVEGTGPASTIAEIGTDVVLSAVPVSRGTRALSKTLGGGGAATVGADVAANAAYSGATAPEDRGSAATWGGLGSAIGQGVAKMGTQALDWGRQGWKRAAEELTSGKLLGTPEQVEAAAKARALRSIKNTVGRDEVKRITNQVENPLPGSDMLPQTTAAKSGSEPLGAMERGAMNRNNVDWAGHQRAVDEASYQHALKATEGADQLSRLKGQETKAFHEGQAVLDKIPLSQANRELISKQVRALMLTNQGAGDASGSAEKAVKAVMKAIDPKVNPQTTLGVLSELYTTLDGSVPIVNDIKGILKKVADERSGGQFTNILTGYGVIKDEIKSAESAAKVWDEMMGSNLTPRGGRKHGETGTYTARFGLDEKGLRDIIADNPGLDEEGRRTLQKLADQLQHREIYKAKGKSTPDHGAAEEAVVAGVNTGPFWRFRGAIKAVFGPIHDQTEKAIDEALKDPEKFLELIDARKRAKAYVEPWKRKLETIIRAGGQIGARTATSAGSGE